MSSELSPDTMDLTTLAAGRRALALSPQGRAIVRKLTEYLFSTLPSPLPVWGNMYVGGFTREGVPEETNGLASSANIMTSAEGGAIPFELLSREETAAKAAEDKKWQKAREYVERYSPDWRRASAEEEKELVERQYESWYGRQEFIPFATLKRNVIDEFGLPETALDNIGPRSTVEELAVTVLANVAFPQELSQTPSAKRQITPNER